MHIASFVIIKLMCIAVQWESFSLPELERFLTVLNREEAEYIEQVKVKYELLRQHLDSCLSITE